MIHLKNLVLASKHQKPILADVFYTKNKQPKPIVIFCHGYKGFKDWGAWNLMAEKFSKAGFFFVKFNFSHNGGTLDQPIDFPDLEAFGNNNYTKELADLETVITWASSNPDFKEEVDVEHISLIGHSRGGGIVLLTANEDTRVKKVISLAGVCDFAKRTAALGDLLAWKREGVVYVLNGRTKQQMPHFYQFYEDVKKNKTRLDIRSAVENIKIPQLIIHGSKDTSVVIKEAENLHQWNPNSEFKIIENANHVFNTSHPWKEETLSEELDKVTDACLHFLK
jgi:pimeloyl-ACP methyl ester carboxylesterase